LDPVVVYARGTPAQIAQQRDICLAWAARTNKQIIALASDDDDQSTGWQDANRMLDAGAVTQILVSSRSVVPPRRPTSVTQEITPPNVRRPRRITTVGENG
jgi:hypothetical protein